MGQTTNTDRTKHGSLTAKDAVLVASVRVASVRVASVRVASVRVASVPRRVGSVSRTGFTLTELLVVIAIIAIISGLAIPAVMMAIRTGNEFSISAKMSQLNSSVERFRSEKNVYPPDQYYDGVNVAWINPAAANVEALVIERYSPLLQKIAPNHREFQRVPGVFEDDDLPIVAWYKQRGQFLNPTNALNFWLGGGLSDSSIFPLSEACRHATENPATYAARIENLGSLVFYDFGTALEIDPLGIWAATNAQVPVFFPNPVTDVPRFLRSPVQAGTSKPLIYFVDTALPSTASANTLFAPYFLNSAETGYRRYKHINAGESAELNGDVRVIPMGVAAGTGISFFAPGKFQIMTPGIDELFGGLDATIPASPVVTTATIRDNICNFADSKRIDSMEGVGL